MIYQIKWNILEFYDSLKVLKIFLAGRACQGGRKI